MTSLALETGFEADDDSLLALSRPAGDEQRVLEYAVPDAYCAACISAIETALCALPQVEAARVNLSDRRVKVTYAPARGSPSVFSDVITRSGYRNFVLDPTTDNRKDQVLTELVRAMAVAGFAAGNIMLFSVSVWSGADAATRDLFHWISALIAIPAVAYAGRPFFRSAFHALRVGKSNMDVPIAIGVTLATVMSLFETIQSAHHAYFDAAVTLLFFLLIGRTLDHLMRERARSAVTNLARLAPRGALRIMPDGLRQFIALGAIEPGMLLELRPGERVPVDAEVTEGRSSVDCSVVTGEAVPVEVGPGTVLMAGATNIAGALTLRAREPAENSFLARMVKLMEAADGARSGYRRLADRVASVYAPIVHILAASTLVFWGLFGGDWHFAVMNAVGVLIITCPCALALAVPIVHVVAAGRLFERGIMMRDGAGLERAAEITHVAFDKTGTLTLGHPELAATLLGDASALADAASLAARSTHPLSQALVAAAGTPVPFQGSVTETAGQGIEGWDKRGLWRLGSAAWCGATPLPDARSQVWLSRDGVAVAAFAFDDIPRPDAAECVAGLRRDGLGISLLSGDAEGPVDAVAALTGISDARAALTPDGKVAALTGLSAAGRHVLMVGDGINDAPAMRAAHVSIAPSSAADIGRQAADFVFTNGQLASVGFILSIGRRAARIVRQNIVIAIVYNLFALPLAMTGHVTPLIAAIAMSSSSVIVVVNALRLRLGSGKGARA